MKIMKSKTLKASVGAIFVAVVASALLHTRDALAATCGGVTTFFEWGCTSSGEQITPVLVQILNWLAVGVTIAVIGGIIYGAIMYTTSGGNSEQSKKAMGIIYNAFIALALYFAMWALLNWLVPGGIFN